MRLPVPYMWGMTTRGKAGGRGQLPIGDLQTLGLERGLNLTTVTRLQNISISRRTAE